MQRRVLGGLSTGVLAATAAVLLSSSVMSPARGAVDVTGGPGGSGARPAAGPTPTSTPTPTPTSTPTAGQTPPSNRQWSPFANVTLRSPAGTVVGTVSLFSAWPASNDVSVLVRAWNLSPGYHGIHIHQRGVCDPRGPKPFVSAGEHYNPTGAKEDMQAGTFPPLLARSNGRADTWFLTDRFHLWDLFGPSGTAVVVHALPDNMANIPTRYTSGGKPGPDATTKATGDSGDRVACGVIAPPTSGSPTPSPSPTSVSPSPSPTSVSPSPTSTSVSPSPTWVSPTPSPTGY